jgi:predicted negative regulator of RcsB-dependent stress response
MAVELYDEHEQGERVRRWLQANLPVMIVALVISLGGVFGYQQYQQSQLAAQGAAASSFTAMQGLIESGQLDMAEDYFQSLQGRDDSGYYKLGAMMMAAAYVDAGRLAPAIDIYRSLWGRSDIESLRGLIGLRLARLLDAQGSSSDALAILAGAAPVGYDGAWAEATGDIHMSMGNVEQARRSYKAALDSPDDLGFGTSLVQLKYDATGPGAVEADS